jgi:hypothetical protein
MGVFSIFDRGQDHCGPLLVPSPCDLTGEGDVIHSWPLWGDFPERPFEGGVK